MEENWALFVIVQEQEHARKERKKKPIYAPHLPSKTSPTIVHSSRGPQWRDRVESHDADDDLQSRVPSGPNDDDQRQPAEADYS